MKKLCFCLSFLVLLLVFTGCENDGTLNGKSEIVVIGLGNKIYSWPAASEVLFTGDDILWFNKETREIRFHDASVFEDKLVHYEKIIVTLADMELFSANIVADYSSAIYTDMVFYHNLTEDKYYLNESYPITIVNETVRLNARIREENWGLFIYQLGIEGLLK